MMNLNNSKMPLSLRVTQAKVIICIIFLVVADSYFLRSQEFLPESTSHIFTVFRDAENLTIYLPQIDPNIASYIKGLRVRVSFSQTETIERQIDIDFPAFVGVPFETISSSLCLRISQKNSQIPLPLDCNSAEVIEQELAPADVFWYSASQNLVLNFLFQTGEVKFCQIERCVIELRADAAIVNPTRISRNEYPCNGEISLNGASKIVTRLKPSDDSNIQRVFETDKAIRILLKHVESTSGVIWLLIGDFEYQILGWARAEHIVTETNCPFTVDLAEGVVSIDGLNQSPIFGTVTSYDENNKTHLFSFTAPQDSKFMFQVDKFHDAIDLHIVVLKNRQVIHQTVLRGYQSFEEEFLVVETSSYFIGITPINEDQTPVFDETQTPKAVPFQLIREFREW